LTHTHIIVGAGSAGCVLAEGLSRCARHKVLLIESGPDYTNYENLPPELADGTTPAIGSHDWELSARGPRARQVWLPRGRVVGGSSEINSCIALRPEPTDFVSRSSGCLWSWDRILGCLKDIEEDVDFPDDNHGTLGPLTIRRPSEESLTAASRSFIEVCLALGFPSVEDHNSSFSTGVGLVPLNVTRDGRRISARHAFLDTARSRDNLEIRSCATVDRVLMTGGTAEGVEYRRCGATVEQVALGRHVVLAAGAYGTPAILLRSGLGPRGQLEANGVPVIRDLPGVGANLSDHSQVPVVLLHRQTEATRPAPCVQALLRYSSASPGGVRNDMQICLINHVNLPSYRADLAAMWNAALASSITSNLMAPIARGSVQLKRGREALQTVIEYDFADNPLDLSRHRDGVKHICRILDHKSFTESIRQIHRPSGDILASDEALNNWILTNLQPGHHPVGTAQMGSFDDPMAVVTERLAVRQTGGLYIVDASVIANPVRANTNLTVMALATNAVRIFTTTI